MKIYICSYKRDKVQTLRYIPESRLEDTYVVVQERDQDRLKDLPVDKIVLPDSIRDISSTRQFLLDTTEGKQIQLDDDITVAVLRDPRRYNLVDCSPEQLEPHLQEIEGLLDWYPIMGCTARNEAHLSYARRITEVGRHIRFHAINTDVVNDLGVRFDRVTLAEDYDFILQLLEKGRPNAIYNQLFVGDNGSNSEGGCKDLRESIDLFAEATSFQSLHPEGIVKVVEKTTKTKDGEWTRPDVRIQWKKAFEYGCQESMYEAML